MEVSDSRNCYCLRTRKAASSIKDFYDRMLAPAGVTVRQYSLLLNISNLQDCSVRELSDATELDRSTLTRGLKPLFNGGYIIDTKDTHCRDSRLRLTEKGQRTLSQAAALWRNAQDEVAIRFGVDGMQKLNSVLEMLQKL